MTSNSLARKAVKVAALAGGPFARRRPGDVVVLVYHRVADGSSEIDLPPRTFERQLAALVEREPVLSFDGAVAALNGGGNGVARGGVALTFDDGTSDFYDAALPLLRRYRVPALLYLATGSVEDRATPDSLSWGQLREAIGTGLVTVGAHTHSHADLSRAGERQASDEMRRSKELVEDRLGTACRHFAYPWGVASPAADAVARRLFDTAALGWGTNRRHGTDPHRLGRTPVLRSDGDLFFRAKVRGLLDGEALAYRALRRGPWARSRS